MNTSSIYSIAFIFVVMLHTASLSTVCMERDDQIHRYMISSSPPFDNYYNISKAVYPSINVPSLLIKVTITFLTTTDNATQRSTAGGKMHSNRSRIDSGSLQTQNITMAYTWSSSCLYVSGGDISLTSMNIFSLWAIYPNRRERQLHLTLPQFCKGSPDDPPRSDTVIYFLSTIQDMAVLPSLHDPRLNTAECVITGHDKAPNFGGLKQLLHGVSWSILSVSLVMHMFASQSLILQLKEWSKKKCQSKTAAVMVLTVIVFTGGITLSIYALYHTNKHKAYTVSFLVSVIIVLLRRCGWYIYKQYPNYPEVGLISGHEEKTSKNIFSLVTLYPAVFIACHHVLWIFLGIATEPFWGITVLVAVLCVSFAFYFLFYQFYEAVTQTHEDRSKGKVCFDNAMISILTFGGFFVFVLLIMVLIIVSQVFLSESLISTLVQNGAVVVATYWFRHYTVKDEEGEGAKLYRVCCLSHDVGEERQGDGGNVNRVRCLLHVVRAGRDGGREEGGVEGRVNDEEGGGGGGGGGRGEGGVEGRVNEDEEGGGDEGGQGDGGVHVLEEVELQPLHPHC